jgi:hypothetical protein
MNALKSVKTMRFNAKDGPLVALMMGLDITDLNQADLFVSEVCPIYFRAGACSRALPASRYRPVPALASLSAV